MSRRNDDERGRADENRLSLHVFQPRLHPVKSFLESRFGIAVGRRLFDCISAARKENRVPLLDELVKPIQLDMEALIDTFTDPAEKARIHYLAGHPRGFIRFALAGMGRITDIAEAMMEKTAEDIDLWVPLMMNTESAYEGSASLLGFEDQKRIMMDVTVNGKGRIMPFYAYDPRSRTVDDVKAAIEEEGFIGVKLYPPLGFKPWGNEDGAVDENLDGLYRYCTAGRDRPIPITAHCSWSDGVTSNRAVAGVRNTRDYYRRLADPAHWAAVLARYGSLKLNLAHFGGAGEWEGRATEGAPARADRNWAEPIVQLMRDHENVYTRSVFPRDIGGGIIRRTAGCCGKRSTAWKIAFSWEAIGICPPCSATSRITGAILPCSSTICSTS